MEISECVRSGACFMRRVVVLVPGMETPRPARARGVHAPLDHLLRLQCELHQLRSKYLYSTPNARGLPALRTFTKRNDCQSSSVELSQTL